MKIMNLCVVALVILGWQVRRWRVKTWRPSRPKVSFRSESMKVLAGFAKADEKGEWKGLDIDTARAVAAAVFGDASKLKFTPLTPVARFLALQSGEVDILCGT